MRKSNQSGSAMIIVATVLAALIAGGGVALYLQMASTRGAGYARTSRSSLYCAEAGLYAARTLINNNVSLWNNMLSNTNLPSWYPIKGDIDEPPDGVMDYEVTIRDNDDEFPVPDPNVDNDQQVFLISKCIKYPDDPREVIELVLFTSGGNMYRNQADQGAGSTNNAN